MIRPVVRLGDGQRAPYQRLGLRMAVRVVEQLGEIVEAYRHIGMIRVGGWFRGRVLDGREYRAQGRR
jgi:hypothetical protein